MRGYEVVVPQLHTGASVAILGLYPISRRQLRRANEFVEILKMQGLPAHVEERERP